MNDGFAEEALGLRAFSWNNKLETDHLISSTLIESPANDQENRDDSFSYFFLLTYSIILLHLMVVVKPGMYITKVVVYKLSFYN